MIFRKIRRNAIRRSNDNGLKNLQHPYKIIRVFSLPSGNWFIMLNQYTSTYQKDYTWPHVSGVRRPPTVKHAPCTCIDSRQVFQKLLDLSEKSFDWSRMGPMGRLLDPKLYSTKVEPISDMNATLFDQPCTFLQKVHISESRVTRLLFLDPEINMTRFMLKVLFTFVL